MEVPSEPHPLSPEVGETPSHGASPESSEDEAEEGSTPDTPQPDDLPLDAELGSFLTETLPGEAIVSEEDVIQPETITKDVEESSSDSIHSELISNDEQVEEEVQGEPGPLSASPECAVSDQLSEACGKGKWQCS